MIKKDFKDISWLVDEPTYRADPALSYSTLAKYERGGFNSLNTLFEEFNSPHLVFGSAVDCLITEGQVGFDKRFFISPNIKCTESIKNIITILYDRYKESYYTLSEIPNSIIEEVTKENKYQLNWKPETRVRKVREEGDSYYSLLYETKDKIIIDLQEYDDIIKTVDALKTSRTTKMFFDNNNPFEDVKRYYQLKFKSTYNNINYRCMSDLIIVDYKNKKIIPIDLKTSSKPEYEFFKSFVSWNYDIQARLYYRIIKDNIEKDEYFKDFELLPFRFIVINKRSLTPLIWKWGKTKALGDITIGIKENIILRDPYVIGEELYTYLQDPSIVPKDIKLEGDNMLEDFLDKY